MILLNPSNVLFAFALDSMDQAIASYTSIVQVRSSPRLVQNRQWLLRLRQRAIDRVNQSPHDRAPAATDDEKGTDTGLLGWRTRLIERGTTRGSIKATIIFVPSPNQSNPTPTRMTETSGMTKTITHAVQQHFVADESHVEIDPTEDPSVEPSSSATDHFVRRSPESSPFFFSY